MTEKLHFDLVASQTVGHRLAITVPHEILDRLTANQQTAAMLKELRSKRVNGLVVESGHGNSRLFVNDKRLGASTDSCRLVNNTLKIVTALDLLAESDQKDPGFCVQNNHQEIAWPKLDETAVGHLTTEFMRATATKLKYDHKSMIPELVYAQVFRDRFVTLQTNNLASCSFDTVASVYDPPAPRFELFAHNICSPLQQFIGLVGGVAIARADQLA